MGGDRIRVAVHEAGHAVVATATGVEVLAARCEIPYADPPSAISVRDFPDPVTEICVRLAGREAERMIFGDYDVLSDRSDMKLARSAAQRVTGSPDAGEELIEALTTRVQQILEDRWRELNATSFALDDRGRLTGQEVRQLCPPTEAIPIATFALPRKQN